MVPAAVHRLRPPNSGHLQRFFRQKKKKNQWPGGERFSCFFFLPESHRRWAAASRCGFFFSTGKVARGGRWMAAPGRRWNRQRQGVVANMCEGELIICFANIYFLCIFLRSLMCQNLCGVHKNFLLCTGHIEDALFLLSVLPYSLILRVLQNTNFYLFYLIFNLRF
jgi:hypothetical protein